MGCGIKINISFKPLASTWNPEQALAGALADRERFLQANPSCRQYQLEIDKLLDKAGTAENRMSVLALLMESKLIELHQQLKHLNALLLRAV